MGRSLFVSVISGMAIIGLTHVVDEAASKQPTHSVEIIPGHRGPIGFGFVPDTSYFVVWERGGSSRKASLTVWDTDEWTLRKRKELKANLRYGVDFYANHAVLVAMTDEQNSEKRREYILSIPDCELRRFFDQELSSVHSPDGQLRAYHPLDGDGNHQSTRIVVEEVKTKKVVLDFAPYLLKSTVLGFSPDSKYLVYAGRNQPLRKRHPKGVDSVLQQEPPFRLWNIAANKEEQRGIKGGWRWLFVGFTKDSKRLVTASDSQILVTDFDSNQLVSRYEFEGTRSAMALDPSGAMVAFRSQRKAILWDHSKRSTVAWECHIFGPSKLLFSPDGKWLVTYGARDQRLLVWRVETLMGLATQDQMGRD